MLLTHFYLGYETKLGQEHLHPVPVLGQHFYKKEGQLDFLGDILHNEFFVILLIGLELSW